MGLSSPDRICDGGQMVPMSQLLLAPPDNDTFGPLAFPEVLQNPGDVKTVNDPLVSVNGSACAITAVDRQKLIASRRRNINLTVRLF